MADWDEHLAREVERYEDGEARLPDDRDERQRQLTRMGNAAGGAGLALLMAGGVNCLVLDEPTNHLDLAAIEQLESALADFEGTLIVVSHDRRFLEALALTHTVEL